MNLTDNNCFMYCNCKTFAKDLLIIFRDTVLDLNEKQCLWKKLRDFVKKYSYHIRDENGIPAKSCSQELYTMILKKLEEKNIISYSTNHSDSIALLSVEDRKLYETEAQETWNGIKLLTEICNIIDSIYFLEMGIVTDRCILRYYVGSGSWLKSLAIKAGGSMQSLTALVGKSEYMKMLVNLGLLSSLKEDSSHLIEVGIDDVLQKFLLSTDIDYENTFSKKLLNKNMPDSIFFWGDYFRSLKRNYLAMIAILAVQLKLMNNEENKAKEYISCLRMYFSITADPFLTLHEVRRMLYEFLYALEKLDLFESFYEEFVKIMPECPADLEPSRLIDITRCQIRKYLKNCHLLLPEEVVKLNLAPTLEEFFLGNIIQISRKRRDVSPEQIVTKTQLDDFVQQSPRF